jgi:hypothetical protein
MVKIEPSPTNFFEFFELSSEVNPGAIEIRI